ncbi:MAG: ABC transporter ATP-binding protein [Anaerolineales bacterium]|nr:ABC transporter ATP-binding protein [Anaerolineales bacterium]
MTTVISVENLSKSYRLGQIGSGTFAHDLNVWWAKVRGRPNPLQRIGAADHHRYDDGEFWALKDLTFKVNQGEVLGIIGRNGAGKSTLLKILSRVTAPTSGKVKVKGRIASLLEVGTGFHPDLTGRENTYLNGAILGMNRKEVDRKFDEIVYFSEVEKFIDTPVKRYSSGMYVRLGFAVAAHLEPEILVVDEVLAVGDVEFQKKCLGKMGDVAKEGRTVLFVSHNMGAIASLCSKGIWLEGGRIKIYSKIQETISSYLDIADTRNAVNNPVDVSDVTRKRGSGEIRVTKVGLLNINEKWEQHFSMEDDFLIRIEIENFLNIMREVNCWFSIATPDGTVLGTGIQYDNSKRGVSVKGLSTVILDVTCKEIPFVPGVYFLNVGVLGKQKEILDWCEMVLSFEITDLLKNGSYFDNRVGKMILRSTWHVVDKKI